jgi:hypothetical protein
MRNDAHHDEYFVSNHDNDDDDDDKYDESVYSFQKNRTKKPAFLSTSSESSRSEVFDAPLFFSFFETHLAKEYNIGDREKKKSKKSPSSTARSSPSFQHKKKKSPRFVNNVTNNTLPISNDEIKPSKSAPTMFTDIKRLQDSCERDTTVVIVNDDVKKNANADYHRFLKKNKDFINGYLTISIGFKENILKQIFETYDKKEAERLARTMMSLYERLEAHLKTEKTTTVKKSVCSFFFRKKTVVVVVF